MISLSRIGATALADFRERSRRYSFWIFLILIAYAAYLFLPTSDAGYSCVSLGANRGIYNSAWVGAQITLMTVVILAMVGFYFVRGAIGRDIRLHVHEVTAATSMHNFEYVAGKAASNMMVLSAMTLVLALLAAILQLVRGESTTLDLYVLLSPFLAIILPVMILIAALAAMFDSVRWLRGGIGNVVFYILWVVAIINTGITTKAVRPIADLFGVSFLWNQMMSACAASVPGYVPWEGPHSLGFNIHANPETTVSPTFVWDGPAWGGEFLLGRLLLLAVAMAAVAIGASAFRRTDAAAPANWKRLFKRQPQSKQTQSIQSEPIKPQEHVRLTPLNAGAVASRMAALVVAELRLITARVSLWWYLIAGGLIIAGLLAPFNIAFKYILPAAWFWPLLLWSQLGCREKLHETEQIVFTAPHFLMRQYLAQWVAGFLLSAGAGAFVAIRFLTAGEAIGLAHWLVGAAMVPSLAMCCGALTGGRKMFEVIYTMLWYIGPLNKAPLLDFTGSATVGTGESYLAYWIATTFVLIAVSFLARWRQARSR